MLIRVLRTSLRTAHLIAFGAYYGGHMFDVDPEQLWPALAAVVATGGLFVGFETWRAPVFLVQVRGLATYVKAALLVCVALAWDYRAAILTLAAAIGAVVSHLPSQLRYYSILHGRMVDTDAKG